MPWIAPDKELNAFETAVSNGFMSRAQVIRDIGGDPAVVDAQLKADKFDVRPVASKTPSDPQAIDNEPAAEKSEDVKEQDDQEAA
jgi:capsid protein